jgi:hypothetical protein
MPPKKRVNERVNERRYDEDDDGRDDRGLSSVAGGGGGSGSYMDEEPTAIGASLEHVPRDLGDFYARRGLLIDEMLKSVHSQQKFKGFQLSKEERDKMLKTIAISEQQIEELRSKNERRGAKMKEIADRNDSEVATEVIQLAMHAIESTVKEPSDAVVSSLLGFCVVFTADQLTYRATSISLSDVVYNVLTALVGYSITIATNKVILELALNSIVVADCAGYGISRHLLEHFSGALNGIGRIIDYAKGRAKNTIEYIKSNDRRGIIRDTVSVTCYHLNRVRLSSTRMLFNIKEKIIGLSRKISYRQLLNFINSEAILEDGKMGVKTSDRSSVSSSIKQSIEYKNLVKKARLESSKSKGKTKNKHSHDNKKTHARKSSKVYKNNSNIDADKAIGIVDAIIEQTEEHINKQNTEVRDDSQLTFGSSPESSPVSSQSSSPATESSPGSSPDNNMNVAGGGGGESV